MSNIFENKGAFGATIVVAASDSLKSRSANYVCDGVDDQVEIQAAIDVIDGQGGGTVVLLGDGGTFSLSRAVANQINLCSNLTLIVRDATLFLANGTIGGGTGCVLLGANTKTNIEIVFQNSWADMNVANQTPNAADWFLAVNFTACSDIKVRHVKGKNIGATACHGAVIGLYDTCSDFTIEDIYGESLDNVLTLNGASDGMVSDIRAKDWSMADALGGIIWLGAFVSNVENVHISGVHGKQVAGGALGRGIGLHITAEQGYKLKGVTFEGIYAEKATHPLWIGVDADVNSEIYEIEGQGIIGYQYTYGLSMVGNAVGKMHNVTLNDVRSLVANAGGHNIDIQHAVDCSILGVDAEGALFETLSISHCYRCWFEGRLKNPQRNALACFTTMEDCIIDIEAIDDQGTPTMDKVIHLEAATAVGNHITIRRADGWTVKPIRDSGTDTVFGNCHQPMSVAFDLTGGATDIEIFHAKARCVLVGYEIFYSVATGGGAGVNIRVGRYQDGVVLDDDYFDVSASELNKAKGYSKHFGTEDLIQQVIDKGDTITVGTAGGKADTGEVILILQIVEMAD